MTTPAVNPHFRDSAHAETRFKLGLWEWWEGNEATALELFSEAATTIRDYVDLCLPEITLERATDFTGITEMGALAASLSGQEQLARQLFAQAELFATGLITGEEPEPWLYEFALDKPDVVRPYTRAYSLIRLGRLSGFKAYVYTVPLEQARKATPVWTTTDIHQALDTANLCFELWRKAGRGGMDYLKKKKFEPLLRSLLACLSPSAGEPERLVARQALGAYQDAIHDLYYFSVIYPRVLDLRAAFPHIFA
ncbi:MAG TPA: hypothetical protein VLQ93_07865 [Myxococcaceae bacterium]|nr:hypothetical protein [Myxococcaceae bacterium]